MRAFVIGLAALAFGVTLSACSGEKSGALAPVKTDPAAVEKLVAKLAAETFKGKATAAADIASVRDALPKEIALTWGSLNFDAGVRRDRPYRREAHARRHAQCRPRRSTRSASGISMRTSPRRALPASASPRPPASHDASKLKGIEVFGIETLMRPGDGRVYRR